jgi:CheY-like chemotaxis protein
LRETPAFTSVKAMTALLVLLAAAAGLAVGFWVARERRRTSPAERARAASMSAIEAGIANVINLLNNRLSAIGGFAGLVERGTLSARDREALDSITAEARAAAEIVRDLVHLVQPPGPASGAAHLPSVMSTVLEAQRAELDETGIDTTLDIDPSVTLVAGRHADLEILFRRLLRFAQVRLASVPSPRHLTWVTRPIGASVIVIQIDNGPALPTQARHDLNYFRPTDPSFAGHLELALAQRVAETCGAALRVEPGERGGAEATVTLIPSRLLDAPPRRTRTSGGSVPPGRVLVADDDDANRRALSQLLQSHGHEVVTAVDGVEALERLAATRFDAVVVDLQMPRLGGRGVYEEVQRREPALARRFVFVTGDDVRAASHEFLADVQQPTVRKPYEIADLLAAVEAVAGPS